MSKALHPEPLVSVIMPVYNAEKYLSKSINSIIGQTYEAWELIIIDDGSKDHSSEIIRSYNDSRIRVYTHKKNKGVSPARNHAIRLAKGKYLAMQDADDISLPKRLECQVKYLEKNSKVGLIGSNYEVISDSDEVIDETNVFTDPKDLKISIVCSNQFGQGTVMLRRELLNEESYDENFRLGEDYDLWTRLAHITKIANIKNVLYQWRYHESSTWIGNRTEMQKHVQKVIDREFDYFLKNKKYYSLFYFNPISINGGIIKYLHKKALMYRNLSYNYMKRRLWASAFKLILLAILIEPTNKINFKYLRGVVRCKCDDLEYEGI